MGGLGLPVRVGPTLKLDMSVPIRAALSSELLKQPEQFLVAPSGGLPVDTDDLHTLPLQVVGKNFYPEINHLQLLFEDAPLFRLFTFHCQTTSFRRRLWTQQALRTSQPERCLALARLPRKQAPSLASAGLGDLPECL